MALNKFKDNSVTPVHIEQLKVGTGIVAAGGNTDTYIGLNTKRPPNEGAVLIDEGGDGNHNTALGYASLASSNLAAYNTAIGSRSQRLNLAGGGNTSVGYRSLENVLTASSNTSVGAENSVFLTTGSRNTSIGYQSLAFNSTGDDNTAVGYRAIFNLTTGARNTCVGTQAGINLSSGVGNVAIGFQTLFSCATTEQNTAVGYQALANALSINNTAIGHQAGFSLSSNSSCTFVGAFAGQVATGVNCNFFGTGAGSSVTTGANNTILGAYTGNSGGLDIRTSGNNIVLSDGAGTWRLHIDSSGYVKDVQGKLRAFPQNSRTSAYTLVATDTGKHISITTGGVTVPSSVFSIGDYIIIVNNSVTAQTISQGSGVTLRLSGTSSTGNRTLAAYGVARVLCIASNIFVVYGNGVT